MELRSRRQIFEARHHLQRRGLPQRHQEPAGHGRRRQLLVAHRLQRAQGALATASRRSSRCIRSPASICRFAGSLIKLEVRLRPIADRRSARSSDRHPRGQPAADGAEISSSPQPRTTASGFSSNADWYVTAQRPAHRQPVHAAGRPGTGRRNSVGNVDLLRSGHRRVRYGVPTIIGSLQAAGLHAGRCCRPA